MADTLVKNFQNSPLGVGGKLDLLAIGVHPDDVELGCSGTIINEIKNGKATVAIVAAVVGSKLKL